MTPSILEQDILRTCGRTYAERGRAYQRAGKVREVEWDAEEQTLVGTVAGSGRNVYEQEILVNSATGRLRLEGYCTCPMEENCKHVAAVLYEWLSRNDKIRRVAAATQPKMAPKKVLTPLAVWQQQLTARLTEPASRATPPAGRQALLYLLTAQPSRQATEVTLTLLKSRPLQRGGWGKAMPVPWYQLTGSSYYTYGYSPDLFDPLDQEIIELLRKDLTSSPQARIAGDVGALLLRRLAQSGRCFLQSLDTAPLIIGATRRADFQWQPSGNGEILRIRLDGDEEPWLFLPTDPPWYLDPVRHRCGLIDQPLAPQLFHALCRLPPVPDSELPALSRFLLPLVPAQTLPLPAELSINRCEQPPVPVLQLRGQSTNRGTIHLARLCFDYGPCRLRPWIAGQELHPLLQQGDQDWLITRDPMREQQHLDCLQSMGLVAACLGETGEAGECDLLFTGQTLAQSAGRWQLFLRDGLPRLAALNWRIETDASFRLRFTSAERLNARIEEGGGGWFEVGLDLDHQGRSIPLLPLLIQLLEEGGDPAQGLLIPGENGEWLEIPPTMLAPILQTLFELFQRPTLGAAGQLRLHQSIAPWLDELHRRLGAGGIELAWQGGERIRVLAERLRDFTGIKEVPAPKGLKAELRPYQRQGLSWLQFLREFGFGGILADDMGLGKTVQTLAHLLVEKEAGRLRNPALVVAPTSVLGNWRREAERFAPSLRVLVLHGPQRSEHFGRLGEYDLLVTSYALLPRDGEALCRTPLHSVILDEAQAIKNARAKVSQAVCALQADQRFCLTGTPMENHLGELWSIFHFLMPGFLGQESAFNTLFRHPIEKRADIGRRHELVRRIAPFVLRRDKGEVARELPAKSEIVQSVELEGPQRRLYESIRIAMAEKISALLQQKGMARSHIEMLDALLKLRQACCDPRLVKLDSARGIRSSAKLELLMEMIDELLQEGRRVLLFSQFTSMLALIESELAARRIRYLKLTGQSKRREELVDRFQRGEAPLFLISLKAGGVGLNLTAADTVIHYDPWWNPAVERQATDRAHRIGQDKPVFVYKLVATDTVEEKILQLQARKQALADDIYRKGKDGEALAALSAEEILSLFAP
jgi:superfamily II DNA or RNA helicase